MQKKIYAVIGSPINHSKSPYIYNYLFEKYKMESTYIAIELKEDNIELFLKQFAAAINLQGINVTMPLKEKVSELADKLDFLSRLLKSVNTLDLTTGIGYTTDGKGLLLSLKYQEVDIEGKNVVVLGSGGAARSICYELAQHPVDRITILNRTVSKAQELAHDVGGGIYADSLSLIGKYTENCDLLINCTSVGMGGKEFEDLSFVNSLKQDAFVYDIIYEPRCTALLKAAKENGIRCSNGLDMLICQAFYSFEIYTGIMPDKIDRNELLKLI